jgi:hypothetical protein
MRDKIVRGERKETNKNLRVDEYVIVLRGVERKQCANGVLVAMLYR